MVKTTCMLIGSFLILHTHGTCIINPGGPLCKVNEEPSNCYGHCQATCSVRVPLCPKNCASGCVCQPGFIREFDNGECIKEETCPKTRCRVNEVPTRCLPGCQEDTCERAGKKKYVCYTYVPVPCKEGCVCQKNYFRNAEGVCTSAADCLKCQRPNEVFGCRRSCDDKICANLNRPCNIVNKRCTENCYCRKGYARTRKSISNRIAPCVPISECPKNCPVNEEYKCVMPCPPNLCRTRFIQFRCRYQACVNKCECKVGFLRNNKGKCVKRNQCEKPKCGENEVFACHITCPPKTCRSMVARIICPVDNPCREQCDCKDNYLRSNDGICIPSKQCFPSTNEVPEILHSEPVTDNDGPPAESDGTSQTENDRPVSPADDKNTDFTENDEDDEIDDNTDDD